MLPVEGVALTDRPPETSSLSQQPRLRAAKGRAETIWDLIADQSREHPQETAILEGKRKLSYRKLTERARAVAAELEARNIGPGALVGVCMGRRWELVAAILGILRAGCAYVPLDPAYPRARVRFMLQHSRAEAVLVDREDRAGLCAGTPRILRLEEIAGRSSPATAGPRGEDLAYVIYTSGSTGRPKGVAVEHRSLVALSQAMGELLGAEELAGVLATTSICFDPSVLEILGTLSLGGTVILAENVLALPHLPLADKVRTSILVPSAMQALLAAGSLPKTLRTFIFGGEVLKRSLVERLHSLEPRPRIINVYGPTEDTVYSTAKEIAPGEQTITLGKPVSNSRSYVLDASLQPVAAGVPGELYLAGDQLARGYLHDEELTTQRFLTPDPMGEVPEARLYKTGDLCRWNEVGELEFLGRKDQQVKIRGFRIELEEIESALESMAGVESAGAAVLEEEGGRKILAAFLVSRAPKAFAEEVRAYLSQQLPPYMVPQTLLFVDQLPRQPSGKLDREALAKLSEPCRLGGEDSGRLPDPKDSPREGAEDRAALLSLIRQEIASLLRLPDPQRIPPDQSFDELGIDSLTAIELGSRLSALLQRKLPLAALLEGWTPASLADHVLETREATAPLPASPQRASKRRASMRRASSGPATGGASEALRGFQGQLQACHPPFLAAKAPAWSVGDKAIFVREISKLVSRPGRDPYGKLVRTGSGHRGIVADAVTQEEREAIIWTTNLYLGLNRDQEVIDAARAAVELLGTGMGTSAAASGITDLHLRFEKSFAQLVGKPAACMFPTGFTANLGVVASLLGDHDVVVMDRLCHASIVDGARLSGAELRTFRHNDAADLAEVLAAVTSPYRTALVVLESVYSMGEGAAPVADIVRTAKKYGALVFVDEAHSFGFYGPRGAGLCAALGVTEEVDFIMTTLSKALGSLGGVVAAREDHVALIRASARAYIFQAAASPADTAAALTALHRLQEDDSLRERLWDTTRYMRERFRAAGYDLGTGDGPIVTPHFSDKEKLFAIVHALYQRGVHTSAVTYPIVESGRGRLRFICSAAHTREDVDRTLEALIDAEREVDEERQIWAASSKIPSLGRPAVEEWAHEFCGALSEGLERATGPFPDLSISIDLVDRGEPITIHVDPEAARVGSSAARKSSYCSLLLEDDRTVAALCSLQAEGILDGMLRGGCKLEGQIEPFIWLIARIAEGRWTSSGSLERISA